MITALCTDWYFVLVGKYIDFKTKVNLFLYRMVKKERTFSAMGIVHWLYRELLARFLYRSVGMLCFTRLAKVITLCAS